MSEEKKDIIEEIKVLISSGECEKIEINENYLEYFTQEELEEIRENLLYKKMNFKETTKEFVDELYEKTKKVGV